MDYLGLLERASEPGPGPTRRQPGSVMVPGPLASALASELSRCHAGPGALPGTPGHTRASLTVILWLKGLSVSKREQSAAASDGPCLRSLSSWPRAQQESVQCCRPMWDTGAYNPCRCPLTGTDGFRGGTGLGCQ